MSVPFKPWELPSTNFRESVPPCCQNVPQLGISNAPMVSPVMPPAVTPPLPSRANNGSSMLNSNSMMNQYSMLNSNPMLNSYSPYGSYGSNMTTLGRFNSPYSGYNSMYQNPMNSSYNQMPNSINSFSQIAENNTQQAFQSIESMVSAFTSISMMLDSTYHALYNSFRAVISVADHFSRMKAQLVHVFSTLAILRTMRWMYRKLISLLRLRKFTDTIEEVWKDDVIKSASKLNDSNSSKSSWPVLIFLSIVFGSPWLIWKILNSLSRTQENLVADTGSWMKGECEHFIGKANFDFKTQQQDEISFQKDQMITIAPKEMQPNVRGWLLGSVDGERCGLLPANYIEILGKRTKLKEENNVQNSNCCNEKSKEEKNIQNSNCSNEKLKEENNVQNSSCCSKK